MDFLEFIILLIMFGPWLIILMLHVMRIRRRRLWRKAYHLSLLRGELNRLSATGKIDEKLKIKLILHIDLLINNIFEGFGVQKKKMRRQEQLDAAWEHLCHHLGKPPLPSPPWKIQKTEDKYEKPSYQPPSPAKVAKSDSQKEETEFFEKTRFPKTPPPQKPSPTHSQKPVTPVKIQESVKVPASPSPPHSQKPEKPKSIANDQSQISNYKSQIANLKSQIPDRKSQITSSKNYAWKPEKPGALEQVIKVVSGWHRMIAPFLVQNIGWFISIFLFVAGCIFMVVHTTGFSRFLIIASILFAYPLMLMGGAYKLLRKRPELRTAGSVLITLGMLLIPLSIAASVRLTDMDSRLLTRGIGILMVVINLGVFYWIAQLASGIMERSLLHGTHTRLFISLSAIQITAPFVARISSWYFPTILHLLLLGLVGYGMIRFIRDWLKSIFSDQRKIAYYAAGTLVYAALVSFVHLTWRYEESFPIGYPGPFLMILCGFLFYVDAQFKEWKDRYVYLSRFSFVVYALSIISLPISFPSFIPRIITLILGIGVYASVFKYYLAIPPLYLMLICSGFLYHQLILRFFSDDAYFLASLPGISVFFWGYRWLLKRKSHKLSLLCFQTLMILILSLAVWSFVNAKPGLTATTTGFAMTGLLYILLRYPAYWKPEPQNSELMTDSEHNLLNSLWFYAIPASVAITLAYFPLWFKIRWSEQFAVLLAIFSLVLTGTGLKMYHRITEKTAMTIGVILNSALVSVFVALTIFLIYAPPDLPKNGIFHILLILCAGVLLWQSLTLRVRAIFYAALLMTGAAGACIKHTYYPISTGIMKNLIVWGIWVILWRMERIEKLKKEIGSPELGTQYQIPNTQFFILNSRFSVTETVRLPLKQFMVALWVIGIFHFLLRCVQGNLVLLASWILSVGVAMLTTMLILTYFRLLWFWWFPLLLGLAGLIAPFYQPDMTNLPTISFIAVLYALLIWGTTRCILDSSRIMRLADLFLLRDGHYGGRNQVERCTYYTTYLITFSAITAAVWHWLNCPESAILLPICIGMIFFWLVSRYYQNRCHSYAAIMVFIIASLIIHVRVLGISDLEILFIDSRTGLLFAILSFIGWSATWLFSRPMFKNVNFLVGFAKSLYRKPLTKTAVLLALISAGQQILLVWADSLNNFDKTAIFVLGLSSLVLFLTNQRLHNYFLSYISIFSVVLTIVWGYGFLFHKEEPFTLMLHQISNDLWIFLSLFSLGLLFFIRMLKHNFSTPLVSLYAKPLWCASALIYCWTLLKALQLFILIMLQGTSEFYQIWLFLIMGIILFPLLKPLPKAKEWRGLGILIMLTGFVVSLLPFVALRWNGTFQICWGFILWGIANAIIPRVNARFPKWSLSGELYPWAGFLLVAIGIYNSAQWHIVLSYFPRELFGILHCKYVLIGTVYAILMQRHSNQPIFLWLAVIGAAFIGFNLFDRGFAAVIGITNFNSQWLSLSLISLGFSGLSQYISSSKKIEKDFFLPIWWIGIFAYIWSVFGISLEIGSVQGILYAKEAFLPWISIVLAITLFPLLYPLKDDSDLRSIGVLIFLSIAWFSLTSLYTIIKPEITAILMAYTLWILANFALPHFNKKYPRWVIDSVKWLWAGLILIIITPFLTTEFEEVLFCWYDWLFVSLYLFLLLKNTKWEGLSWFATGTFTWAGILLIGKYTKIYSYNISEFAIGTMIWANLLLLIPSLSNRFSVILETTISNLATRSKTTNPTSHFSFLTSHFPHFSFLTSHFSFPFRFWSFMISILFLFLLILADCMILFQESPPISWNAFMVIAFLLMIFFSHLFVIKPSLLNAHSLILSVFAAILTGMTGLDSLHIMSLPYLPMMLVLWSIILFVADNYSVRKSINGNQISKYFKIMHESISLWMILSTWAVIPALLFIPVASLKGTLLTLGLLICVFVGLANQRQSLGLLSVCRILFLIMLHIFPLLWIPSNKTAGLVLWNIIPLLQAQFERLKIVFPWYSLQLVLIIWIITWMRTWIRDRLTKMPFLRENFFKNLSLEIGIAIGELGLHLMVFTNQLITNTVPEKAFIHGVAAIMTIILLMGLGIRRAYHSQKSGWLYGAAILGGIAGIYLRMLWVGLAPLSPWDTTAVIGVALGLFFIQRFTSSGILSEVLLRLVMILPLFAIITTPLHTGSLHTSSALLAAGALYISLRYTTGSSIALYLGTIAINGAIYLWVPAWANRFNLIQLYAVPSALSVLLLLHLHRKELRRSVLNGMRLVAISTLYLCSTLDFFMRPELSNFVLVLFVSLIGVAAGIGLRVRAFLYGGVIFMVLNVLGQLFLFYSQQTVGKGIVLMTMGTLILVGMIWFNIRREDILKRVRIFRADLEQWE